MSTDSNPWMAGGPAAVVALSAWLVACAAAWDGATLSGGNRQHDAMAVADGVGRAARLTPACVALAADLAEASMKARITAYRPTSRTMLAREDRVFEAWQAQRCPDRALAGIAWGVARAVRESTDARRLGGRPRP